MALCYHRLLDAVRDGLRHELRRCSDEVQPEDQQSDEGYLWCKLGRVRQHRLGDNG